MRAPELLGVQRSSWLRLLLEAIFPLMFCFGIVLKVGILHLIEEPCSPCKIAGQISTHFCSSTSNSKCYLVFGPSFTNFCATRLVNNNQLKLLALGSYSKTVFFQIIQNQDNDNSYSFFIGYIFL